MEGSESESDEPQHGAIEGSEFEDEMDDSHAIDDDSDDDEDENQNKLSGTMLQIMSNKNRNIL